MNISRHSLSRRAIRLFSFVAMLCALLFLPVLRGAEEIVTLKLGGKVFGNGKAVSLASGATVIAPSQIYKFKVTGKVRGKRGALRRAFPTSLTLVKFLDSFQSGSAASLKGYHDNPSSALPVSLFSQPVSGIRRISGFGKVRVKLLLAASISNTGEVLFELKDVQILDKNGKLKGTMAFRAGKVVVHTAPVVSFRTANHTVDENAGTVSIVVARTGYLGAPVTVQYATTDDTAVAGTNYESSVGHVAFAANEAEKTISIPVIDNAERDKPLNFNVALSGPSTGAVLGQFTEASVRIMNDDK